MPPRMKPIESEADALGVLAEKIGRIEDSLRDRLLPPGYIVNTVAGNLVLTRTSDGATTTLVFA